MLNMVGMTSGYEKREFDNGANAQIIVFIAHAP